MLPATSCAANTLGAPGRTCAASTATQAGGPAMGRRPCSTLRWYALPLPGHGHPLPVATGRSRPRGRGLAESRMRRQAARPVRERGPEKRAGRKASTALRADLTTADLGKISDATLAGPRAPGTYYPAPAQPLARSEPGPARRAAAEARSSPGRRPPTQAPSPPLDSRRRKVGHRPLAGSPTGYRYQPGRSAGVLPV